MGLAYANTIVIGAGRDDERDSTSYRYYQKQSEPDVISTLPIYPYVFNN